MSKHTPGPWAFCNDTLCQANGRYLHLGKWIESSGLGSAAEPNKMLIAAAPDLLEALRDLEWAVDGVAYIQEEYAEQVAKARAAIAKATGGVGE